jgi:hypothetical protein
MDEPAASPGSDRPETAGSGAAKRRPVARAVGLVVFLVVCVAVAGVVLRAFRRARPDARPTAEGLARLADAPGPEDIIRKAVLAELRRDEVMSWLFPEDAAVEMTTLILRNLDAVSERYGVDPNQPLAQDAVFLLAAKAGFDIQQLGDRALETLDPQLRDEANAILLGTYTMDEVLRIRELSVKGLGGLSPDEQADLERLVRAGFLRVRQGEPADVTTYKEYMAQCMSLGLDEFAKQLEGE